MGYLKSLNQSKKAMNESVVLMQYVYDSCIDLVNTVHATKSQQDQNNTLSEYNPFQLIWNIYYIYTGTALEDKCHSYSNVLSSLIHSIKRILSMQRDFLQQTKTQTLLNKMQSNSKAMTQIIATINFLNQLMFFESDRH